MTNCFTEIRTPNEYVYIYNLFRVLAIQLTIVLTPDNIRAYFILKYSFCYRTFTDQIKYLHPK